MNTFLGSLSLLGFVLSLGVHGSSLFGVDVQNQLPAVWLLHLGIFVVFIPMVLQLRSSKHKSDAAVVFRGLPVWAGATIALLAVYALLNFFVALGPSMAEGSPKIQDGKFVLEKKGKVMRQISETEYHSRQASVVRGFSGHWLIFYFVPFANFSLRRKELPFA